MNSITIKAFEDELTKISFFQSTKDLLNEGWNGTKESPQTWMGRGRLVKPITQSDGSRRQLGRIARGWEEASSLGGLTRALPLGNKAMTAVTTGLAAKDALRKEDPTGHQRSRAERLTGLAGNTVGSILGSTLANRKMPGSIMGSMLGGIGGGILGEKIVSAPFRRAAPPSQLPPTESPIVGNPNEHI